MNFCQCRCVQLTLLGTLCVYANYIQILGHAVAQFVETLSYKPEGRGLDSLWFHWNFSLT